MSSAVRHASTPGSARAWLASTPSSLASAVGDSTTAAGWEAAEGVIPAEQTTLPGAAARYHRHAVEADIEMT